MRRNAFTLIEVLVAIGIIGVLIAIIAPALRGAKGAARETVCLANLKTCHVDMQAYLEAEGEYPFMPADEWYPTSPPPHPSRMRTGQHWDHATLWPTVMHDVAPWVEHYEAWVCPGSDRKPGEPWESADNGASSGWGGGRCSYALSDALRADPDLWSPDPPTDPEALAQLLRPVKPHEVRSPGGKALFYDAEMAHLDPFATEQQKDPRPVGFVDGHAAIKRLSESIDPVPNPLANGRAARLHDTPMGAFGVDY